MFTKYITNTYEITNGYKKILINAKDAKVKIEETSDVITKLVVNEKKSYPYVFSVIDNTLIVKPLKSKWYNFLTIGISHAEIKLYIPKQELDMLSIKQNIGTINISSLTYSKEINIQTNTGSINLENINCDTFDSKGNTGSIILNNLISKKSMLIKRTTGKVILNNSFSPDIFIKTNTGSVSGKLPPNIVFTATTNTGKIKIPNPPIGEIISGRCVVITNTGSIKFE